MSSSSSSSLFRFQRYLVICPHLQDSSSSASLFLLLHLLPPPFLLNLLFLVLTSCHSSSSLSSSFQFLPSSLSPTFYCLSHNLLRSATHPRLSPSMLQFIIIKHFHESFRSFPNMSLSDRFQTCLRITLLAPHLLQWRYRLRLRCHRLPVL
jgi:hypothetical protein